MKNYNIYIIAIFLLVFTGCGEDKLDLYPLTQVTEGTFYKNEIELGQSLDDVYRQLSIHYDAHGLPDLFGELYSDNTKIIHVAGTDFPIEEIDDYKIPTNNNRILTAWDRAYSGIFIANNFLHNLENSDVELTNARFDEMKGQAVFVRSLIYFNLIRAFGAVPYIDKKISPIDAYDYLRIEEKIIFENIINDLIYAKSVLPEKWDAKNVGRVTKYGVAAVLSKVYLTNGDKTKAASELKQIIDSKLYSLDSNNDGVVDIEDLKYLFKADTKNCKSSILEAQYLAGPNALNSDHQIAYSPFYYSFSLPGDDRQDYRGNGINTPSYDLIDEFEPNDPRKDIFLRTGYIDKGSGEFINFPFTMKFYDLNWDNPGQNFEIIRYADILLMYSEVTDDPQYLNMVRERVGLPAYGSNEYPSNKFPTLKLAIEHERRIELCHEFHRFFDLKRTNRALDVIQGLNKNNLLFPIPQYSIDVNPKLTQNIGY